MGQVVETRVRPRLRVYIAGPGKQLFQQLRDPGLKVYGDVEGRDPTPDLVVFPCNQLRDLMAPPRLPPSVQERLQSGKARVVLDGSGEGYEHVPEISDRLHGFVRALGAPNWHAAYITQNRGFQDAYLAHCAAGGVRPMQVLTYDLWIKTFFSPLEARGPDLFDARLEAFRARPAVRPRRFVSLNWTPRPTKALFLLRLLRDGLWDSGYISFGGFEHSAIAHGGGRAKLERDMRRLEGFQDLHAELSPLLPRLEDIGCQRLGAVEPGDPAFTSRLVADQSLPEFGRSWFSVVTESEMSARPHRITEKPFKALVNFHPILVLGNPGSLARIRELGFETFPDVIDETYDDEPDPRRRFEMVYRETARLCRQDEADLARMEAKVAGRLEHNARHGLTRLPEHYRLRIDAALVEALSGLWSHRRAAHGGS